MWATAEDYARITGVGLTESNEEQITALLEAAQAIIEANLPKGCAPPAGAAKAIVIKVAQRARINPGGRTRRRVGNKEDAYDDRGGLFVSDSEIATLSAGCRGATAYTVTAVDAARSGWR